MFFYLMRKYKIINVLVCAHLRGGRPMIASSKLCLFVLLSEKFVFDKRTEEHKFLCLSQETADNSNS